MRNLLFIIIFIIIFNPIFASATVDSDNDGISDDDEINVYKTDPASLDSDFDGYSDWIELNKGFSPHNKARVRLEDNDFDNDGLSDRLELNFHTDLSNFDSDNDGYGDGEEINNYFNPLSATTTMLSKRIEINLSKQELSYFLGGVRMGKMIVSSGAAGMYTPTGYYNIENKNLKAWSSYGLWMPYWMAFAGNGRYGIHELPIWPNGYREGEDHLGTPVSHGCVRLGTDNAEFLYNWADIGTPVFIY